MSKDTILNKPIGRVKDLNKAFIAIKATHPPFQKKRKLNKEAYQSKLRHIFYTDKGAFWGPPIKEIKPDDGPLRQHITFPVKFIQGFGIQNVVCADFDNQQLVKVHHIENPIKIHSGETVQFGFYFDYYV